MSVSPDDFKAALRNFAAGVTIVTSVGEDRAPVGATVSSFASVSADPPMVLVCLNGFSRSAKAVRESRVFSVHILGAGHVELAQRFASDNSVKFLDGAFDQGATGAPVLPECDVRLDCELVSETPGGTHGVFIGLVRHVLCQDIAPLIYANRAFCGAQALETIARA